MGEPDVVVVLGLVIVVAAVAAAVRVIRIPYTVALVLAGVTRGSLASPSWYSWCDRVP